MGFDAEVDAFADAVARVVAVARRSPCGGFADLCWPPCPDPMDLWRNPGVMFESPRRVFVVQRFDGELRYYAGGWIRDDSRILDDSRYVEEQDRMEAEGYELGVLGSVADALALAEQYLVELRSFAAVAVPREVRHSHYPQAAEADPGAAPDPAAM
jgi:hypothetical protein